MGTQKLSNISLSDYRRFLQNAGCSYYKTNSGHEHWRKEGLNRPITFQTHIDPVPEFIIQNALRAGNTQKRLSRNAKQMTPPMAESFVFEAYSPIKSSVILPISA